MPGATLKGGIIGCGRISLVGHGLPMRLHPRVNVAAVCDVREEAAQSLAKQVDGATVYTDMREMLEKEDLDFVCICTPPWLHESMTAEALDHGVHVLLEKPMTTDPDHSERLQRLAERSGKLVMLSYHKRFDPGLARVRELIQEETYGKCFHAELSWRGLWTMAKVPWVEELRKLGDSMGIESEALFPAWRDEDPNSPGATGTVFCHLIDIAMYFFGWPLHWQGEAISVRSSKPDHLLLTMLFEGGRTAQLRMSSAELAFEERDEGRLLCENGNVSYLTSSTRQGLFPAKVWAEYPMGPLPRRKEHTPPRSFPPWKQSANFRKIDAFVEAIEAGMTTLPPGLPSPADGALVDRILFDLLRTHHG